MDNEILDNEKNLLIYTNEEGDIIVDAIYRDESLWLTQKGMANVFDVQVPAISKHLKNIFDEGELVKHSVVSKMEITANDHKKYNTDVYNLDAIIAVGYRINSKKATQFRIWATKVLKEYMTKGFALNDERFIRGNKYDVTIAKNYLSEDELKKLNDLTNLFIVFAEDEAKERHIMTMKDWINATDDLLKFRRKNILNSSGSISHKEAIEKANTEYEKFKVKQDMDYISSMDKMYKRYLDESKK